LCIDQYNHNLSNGYYRFDLVDTCLALHQNTNLIWLYIECIF
jgi:hypothetical protein